MILRTRRFCFLFLLPFGIACSDAAHEDASSTSGPGEQTTTYQRGPHGGRLLEEDALALELSIYEQGVPPEFRAWATLEGEPLAPDEFEIHVRLTRTGDRVDEIDFVPAGDGRRGTQVVYEPHSFLVTVEASARGAKHRWEYENYEGRTEIASEMSEALGIETSVAGPAELVDFVEVYGRIVPDPQRVREVSARFEGLIRSVAVEHGERVETGTVLATVESNESLQTYPLTAPMAGIVTERIANPGEQTGGRRLFTIVDHSRVWALLELPLAERGRLTEGAPVTVVSPMTGRSAAGVLDHIEPLAQPTQTIAARVVLEDPEGFFPPGSFVSGRIEAERFEVPLAVRRSGLQPFRDFTVVYGRFGNVYEVRMLEIGRRDDEWAEVLGGIEPGTPYVSENSFVVKADVEKSGASHDH